jgi:CysZ protein
MRMLLSAIRAIGDLASPEFRGILRKAFGLTVLLYGVVLAAAYVTMQSLTLVKWAWVEKIIDVFAWLGILVGLFLLMAPVTALFAGFYLDRVAEIVERQNYPGDAPGVAMAAPTAIFTAISFGMLVLLINIAILPAIFLGIGAFAILAANAYLLSREFFEMAAARHLTPQDARRLRQRHQVHVFVAGLVPAALAAVPVVNILVPLFATSYFVHLYKHISLTSRKTGTNH